MFFPLPDLVVNAGLDNGDTAEAGWYLLKRFKKIVQLLRIESRAQAQAAGVLWHARTQGAVYANNDDARPVPHTLQGGGAFTQCGL